MQYSNDGGLNDAQFNKFHNVSATKPFSFVLVMDTFRGNFPFEILRTCLTAGMIAGLTNGSIMLQMNLVMDCIAMESRFDL